MIRLPTLALLASCGALAFVVYATDQQARAMTEHAERLAAVRADIRHQESAPDVVVDRKPGSLPDGTPCERVTVISNGWDVRECILPGEPLPTMKAGAGEQSSGGGIPLTDTAGAVVSDPLLRIAENCTDPGIDLTGPCEELRGKLGVESWADVVALHDEY